MKKIHSERWALAALIALVIYCLACRYPAAWSPDSDKVIFPVMREGVRGLAMVGLSGKRLRDVARPASDAEMFSPAAWSPDGKWIAYFKFELRAKDEDEEERRLEIVDAHASALMLQGAESGKEQAILQARIDERDENAFRGNAMYGPQWTADSQTIAIRNMDEDSPGVLLLNTKGEALGRISLPGKAPLLTASLSPDGKHLAYFVPGEEDADKGAINVHNLATNSIKAAAEVEAMDADKGMYPPPSGRPTAPTSTSPTVRHPRVKQRRPVL